MIKSLGGNDTIYAGTGNDSDFPGLGDDVVFGDTGKDAIVNVKGRDNLGGGDGQDLLDGSIGRDTCATGEKVKHCEIGDNEGKPLLGFYTGCPRVKAGAPTTREPFLVVPLPDAPRTLGFCRP